MKKFKLATLLLAIITALTFGFTSCTEEFGGDNTQGKPGYLTINVKTLKLNQSKVTGDGADDFKFIKDLNIFVFNEAGNILIQKYIAEGFETTNQNSFDIPVTTLPDGAYVVAVANYNSDLKTITKVADIEALEITTVRNFADSGLHMTGKATIIDNGTSYYSDVRIAPVESKITVKFAPSSYIVQNYTITGVYIVNAINKTQLPIIRNNNYNGTAWDATASNILPAGFINFPAARTASTGLAAVDARDFNFYNAMTPETGFLSDGATSYESTLHYYVGENYSNNDTPAAGGGAVSADNNDNANTLVVIQVTPIASSAADLAETGVRYYTYELDKNSTNASAIKANSENLGGGDISPVGFSTRRKTNYTLTFNLSTLGSELPFERMRNLTVDVTAEGWDEAGVNAPF